MRGLSSVAAWLAGGLLVLFMLSPLILVMVFAFTDRPIANVPITGLTTHWWGEMVRHPQFQASLVNSALIALIVGVCSSVFGTMAALGLVQMSYRRASLVAGILCLPLLMPPLVLGVSLLTFYSAISLPLGVGSVAISQLIFTLPFVILVVMARMRSFDFAAIASARDLGATPLVAFFTVTLPMIRPTIVGAGLIAMALSLDDFIITFFTIGTGNTLPTLVWGMIRTSLTPSVNAIGTMLIVATLGVSFIAFNLTRYRG